MAYISWVSTIEALEELEKMLMCSVCSKLLQKPCTLGACDHLFCKCCVVNHLGNACPVCGSPAWVKDLLPKRELNVVVQMYQRLKRLVTQWPCDGHDVTTHEDQVWSSVKVGNTDEDVGDDSFLVSDEPGYVQNNEDDNSNKTTTDDEKSNKTTAEDENSKTTAEDEKNSKTTAEDENSKTTAEDEKNSKTTAEDENSKTTAEDENNSKTTAEESFTQIKNVLPSANRKKITSQFYTLPWRMNRSKKKTKKLTRKRCPKDSALHKENIGAQQQQVEETYSFSSTSIDSCPVQRRKHVSAELRKQKLDQSNEVWTNISEYTERGSKRASRRKVYFREVKDLMGRSVGENQVAEGQDTQLVSQPVETNPVRRDLVLNSVETCVTACDLSTAEGHMEITTSILEDTTTTHARNMEGTCTRMRTRLSTELQLSQDCLRKHSKSQDNTPCLGSTQCDANTNIMERMQHQGDMLISTGVKEPTKQLTWSAMEKRDTTLKKRVRECDESLLQKRRKSHSQISVTGDHVMRRNKKGETPLHTAAIKGDVNEAKQLLLLGADPNATDYAGWRPLHEAANHGHASTVSLLLHYGAIIDAPGFENDSPLHDALANHRLDVVKMLVQCGANVHARNMFGVTPFDLAKTNSMKMALKTRVSKEYVDCHPIKSVVSNNHESFVFVCTGLNDDQKMTLEICAALLNGQTVKEFNDDVTHVIASCKDGLCLRTLKYLQGVVSAKWVISFDWVDKCLSEQRAVDEESFVITGTISSPQSPGPMRARINADKQFPPLFDGCNFYFRGNFTKPSKKDLVQLVKSGGGTVLLREPKLDNNNIQSSRRVPYHAIVNSNQANCCHYIINSPLQDCQFVHSPVLCSVPLSWLMDCVGQFKLLSVEEF